jgi:hypothetical protein
MRKKRTEMAVTWSPVPEEETRQAGVFIIRIWKEPEAVSGFRARIIQTLDLSAPQEVVSAASSAQDICDAVQRWIGEFVTSQGR